MDNEYVYMFVDNTLPHQQQVIQVAHAAARIGDRFHSNTHAVLCSAESEGHLYAIAEHLEKSGIDYEFFWEPDISQYTAIATKPLKGKERLPMRKFKLM